MDVLGNIKTGIDLIGAIVGEAAFGKYRGQLREIEGSLISARTMISQLLDEKDSVLKAKQEAEQELVKLKAWDAEKANYELVEIFLGVFVYGLKASVKTGEPKHCLCPRCYERSQKSILQVQYQVSPPPLECSRCHARYHPPPPPLRQLTLARG